MPQSRRNPPVTSRDVARLAGVSQATVSRVLNGGPVAEDTRRRVNSAIDSVGYYPNDVARSLISQRTRFVGILIPDITNPFYSELLEHLEARLVGAGYRVSLLSTRRVAGRAAKLIEVFLEQRVYGVILSSESATSDVTNELKKRGLPVVSIGESPVDAHCAVVATGGFAGTRLATEHIISLGHSRVAFIRGTSSTAVSVSRESGFRETTVSHGLNVPSHYFQDGLFTYEGGRAAAHRLFSRAPAPTAIVCANDVMAFGAMDAASERHLQIPRDVSILGFDDVRMAGWPRWALTTIRQPVFELARAAVDALIVGASREDYRQQLPERRVFSPRLVERSTTASPGTQPWTPHCEPTAMSPATEQEREQ